jgi:hypothetical protein
MDPYYHIYGRLTEITRPSRRETLSASSLNATSNTRTEKLDAPAKSVPQALEAQAHFQRLGGPSELGPLPDRLGTESFRSLLGVVWVDMNKFPSGSLHRTQVHASRAWEFLPSLRDLFPPIASSQRWKSLLRNTANARSFTRLRAGVLFSPLMPGPVFLSEAPLP